jgi:hypothetical protein
MSSQLQFGNQSATVPENEGAPHPIALYLRAADTLERSAALAEDHARRCRDAGAHEAADLELERARRARIAAQRVRALAVRLRVRRFGMPDDLQPASPLDLGPSGSVQRYRIVDHETVCIDFAQNLAALNPLAPLPGESLR